MKELSQCSDCHQTVELYKLDDHLKICTGQPDTCSLELPGNILITTVPRRSRRNTESSKNALSSPITYTGTSNLLLERMPHTISMLCPMPQRSYLVRKTYERNPALKRSLPFTMCTPPEMQSPHLTSNSHSQSPNVNFETVNTQHQSAIQDYHQRLQCQDLLPASSCETVDADPNLVSSPLSPSTNHSLENVPAQNKRKRGRPRKLSWLHAESCNITSVNTVIEESLHKEHSLKNPPQARSEGNIKQNYYSHIKTHLVETPKRKRGRPCKRFDAATISAQKCVQDHQVCSAQIEKTKSHQSKLGNDTSWFDCTSDAGTEPHQLQTIKINSTPPKSASSPEKQKKSEKLGSHVMYHKPPEPRHYSIAENSNVTSQLSPESNINNGLEHCLSAKTEIPATKSDVQSTKRRGRPPKNSSRSTRSSVEHSITVPSIDPSLVKGADPNSGNDISCTKQNRDSEDQSNTLVKRKRGRPPKISIPCKIPTYDKSVEAVSEINADMTSVVNKRRTPTVKRKRGRHQKNKPVSTKHMKRVSSLTERLCNRQDAGSDGEATVKKTVEPEQKLTQEFGDIDCGKCDETKMTLKVFTKHKILKHSGLARPKGESQDFTVNEGLKLIHEYFCSAKKWKCLICEKNIISEVGAKYHYRICGKKEEDKVQECPVCEQMIRVSQYQIHRSSHSQKKKPTTSIDDSDLIISRPRRNGSYKPPVYEGLDFDISDAEDDFMSNNQEVFSNVITKDPHNITRSMIKKWGIQLDSSKCCFCPNKGCGKSFPSKELASNHVAKQCTHGKCMYRCAHCYFRSENKDDVIFHALEEEHNGDDIQTKSSPRRKVRTVLRTDLYIDKTKQFRMENYVDKIFSSLLFDSSKWQELDESRISDYSPKLKKSPPTSSHRSGKSMDKWNTLELFGHLQSVGGPIFFTGGPIVASSWCPLPDDVVEFQYLALSIDLDPDKKQTPSTKGMIQIWKYCEGKAEIALVLVFDYGRVNSLDWCPSGAYTQTDGCISRLGILAGACSDGSSRIFVIPDPSKLKCSRKWFQVTENLALTHSDWEPFKFSCSKLTWHQGRGHRFVATGWSDGSVAKYDVTMSCELLISSGENGVTWLHPVTRIMAHPGARITALSFSPLSNGDEIFTGGSDRWGKYWDLLEPSLPEESCRKSIPLDSHWPIHWPGCFVSYDDMGFNSKNVTTYKPCGMTSKLGIPVLYSDAAVWSVSASQWLNAVAQIEETGNATVSFIQDLPSYEDSERNIARSQFTITTISTEYLESERTYARQIEVSREFSNLSERNFKEHTSNITGKQLVDMTVDSYEEIAKQSRVIVNDYNPGVFSQNISRYAPIETDEEFCNRIRQHYISHSKCISWNNNLGGKDLVFVGSNSGIGKLVSLNLPKSISSRKLK